MKRKMTEHLLAIQQIVVATGKEDWNAVAVAAKGIHAPEDCEHMAAAPDDFAELTQQFYDRAGPISKAAEAHDSGAVLQATASMLQVCTNCHGTYRQDVVDEASWKERTAGTHMPEHGMH